MTTPSHNTRPETNASTTNMPTPTHPQPPESRTLTGGSSINHQPTTINSSPSHTTTGATDVPMVTDITELLMRHPAYRPSIVPPPPEPFDFQPPSYFAEYELPPDAVLVGDCVITRGDIVLLAGVPGCGKSRLLASLAIAGKLGRGGTWMGMPVHASFKTAILQAENGPVRLKRELGDILRQGHDLDGHLLITSPPPRGFQFTDPRFCERLRAWLERERPGVFAIDPWNRAVADDKAKDFREIIDAIESCLPEHPHRPALVIVAHLRKQAAGEARKHGRDLLPEVSGSQVLTSASRSALILEPATPDPEDHRVVLTCAKNNNGDMGRSTAWYRQNGLFAPCADFDWKEWREDGSGSKTRHAVELEDLAVVFEDGDKVLSKNSAAKALQELTGSSLSTIYVALKPDGRFAAHLSLAGGFYTFKP